jgi:CysZ protein
MKGTITSFSLAIKSILKDPINLLLAIIPTILALGIYLWAVVSVFKNSEWLTAFMSQYIDSPEAAGWVGRFFTALLILFIFLLMSWTFVVVVGIIAAPFNSMLSSRIEKQLTHQRVTDSTSKTMKEIFKGLGRTFLTEIKKLIAILIMAALAFLLNLIPLFYPVGVFLVATLLAVQFVDYSWSRHDYSLGACVKDTLRNVLPYGVSGGFFLILVSVPLINALVPALATAYYTVLWLERHQKLDQVGDSSSAALKIEG